MTRTEFIDQWRHEIGGLVLDAATAQATGAELSVRLRHVMRKIDAHLGHMFDQLVAPAQPKEAPKPQPANGPAPQPQRK